jgi:hypothetical protein
MTNVLCAVRVPPVADAVGYRRFLAERAGFVVTDFGDDVLGIRPIEAAATNREYFCVHRVADANTDLNDDATWHIFDEVPPRRRGLADPVAYRDGVVQRARALLQRQPNDLNAELEAFALSVLGACEVGELRQLLQMQLPILFKQLPAALLLYVTTDDVLLSRAAFGRTQLALELTPDMPTGPDLDLLPAFSAMSLTQGVNFSELMKVPLLALSPATMGVVFPALPHAIVVCFGWGAELRRPVPTSLASLFRPSVLSDAEGLDRSAILAAAQHDFGNVLVSWWTDQLNELFGFLCDPTRWIDAQGFYRAADQTAWLVTLERLIADATSLLAEPQASDLQRLQIAFDLLDKTAQLVGYPYKQAATGFEALLRRKRCMPVIRGGLAKHLPGDLAAKLANEAGRLFDELYDEMLKDALSYRRVGQGIKIAVGRDPAALENLDHDTFVARTCRAVRNSSHGLLDTLKVGKDRFLLAAHTGGVPAELAALAPLIALGVLGDPAGLIDGSVRSQLSSNR